MSDNKFDNYFRDRLQDHVSPVPADMWQRIHPDRRRGKGIFFWITWLGVPVLILAGLYVGYRSFTSVATPSDHNIPPTLITQSNQTTSSSQTTQPGLTTSSTPIIPSNKTTSIPVTPSDHTTSSTQATPSIPTIPSTHTIPSTLNPSSNHTFPSTSNTPSNITTLSNHITPSTHTTPSFPPSGGLVKSAVRLTIQRQRFTFDHRPSPPADTTKPGSKKQPARTSKWYIDALVSPDLPLNRMGRLSYTAGFRLGRSFGQHFTGSVGIQYSRIRESNNTIDSMGPVTNKLTLKTLDIPLSLGYRTTLGRANITFTGGVIFNIHSWEKLELGSSSPGERLYRPNTGLSACLGLNYLEPLTQKLSLFAEPYIRYRLSDMKDNDYWFPRKLHVAGLSLGLRYHL